MVDVVNGTVDMSEKLGKKEKTHRNCEWKFLDNIDFPDILISQHVERGQQ